MQVISLSGCTSPPAGQMKTWMIAFRPPPVFQGSLRAAAAAWLAQAQTVCFSGQGQVESAGYQLHVMPSALRTCQRGKRDVSLVPVCKEKPEFNDT